MRVSDFHFDLPEELIAQTPPVERGASRMLLLARNTGALADHRFGDLPHLLCPGDLLVLNDTRVLPARLYARKHKTPVGNSSSAEGLIEVLLTEPAMSQGSVGSSRANVWNTLVRPAKKIRIGDRLAFFAEGNPAVPLLTAEVTAAGAFGERTLRFAPEPEFLSIIERIGHMPLPPYIRRPHGAPDRAEDRERYQTVYARGAQARTALLAVAGSHARQDEEGEGAAVDLPASPDISEARDRSAAAPTAGLHFTPEILTELTRRGVEIATLTLHVGRGTFQPVRVATTEEVRLHAERYTLSAQTAAAINRARREDRRIIAVGTTTTRTLEHCARLAVAQGNLAAGHPVLTPGSGETSLFLSPGDPFHIVSGLLTNFHLPESTLLMLVSAFAGRDIVLRAYQHAVTHRYRFFSYGDCMLIL